jgi:hypothetical protein
MIIEKSLAVLFLREKHVLSLSGWGRNLVEGRKNLPLGKYDTHTDKHRNHFPSQN